MNRLSTPDADPRALLDSAELLVDAAAVAAAVDRLAAAINARMSGIAERPLVLAVMRGGLIFAGQLLPRLSFPLELDYVDASRYGKAVRGGELYWRSPLPEGVAGRTVLLVDDILDEGITLAAIRDRLLALGAAQVLVAVFADKRIPRSKPLAADFSGIDLPDRYVFGFGMDVHGLWRNLPAVYALREGGRK